MTQAEVKENGKVAKNADKPMKRYATSWIRSHDGFGGKDNVVTLHAYNNLYIKQDEDLDEEEREPRCGIVLAVNNVRLMRFALLSGDLCLEQVATYPEGNKVVFASLDDDLHKFALELLDKPEDISTYEWMQQICTHFNEKPELNRLSSFNYPAHNKYGGSYQGAILGIKRVKEDK